MFHIWNYDLELGGFLEDSLNASIHPLRPGQKEARIQSGRWKRL